MEKSLHTHKNEFISDSSKALIFNIQRFSIHDGPGIRTVVFFKGCPLRCLWCHNPEGQFLKKEMVIWDDRCIGCKTCVKICRNSAIDNPENCILCGECVEECPAEAREIAGKEMTVEEVMMEIEKDRVFYEQSGGGVTFSGGEPLLQHDFLLTLLKKCKENNIHTVIETCGYSNWEILLSVSKYTDLFLFDLKVMDEDSHKKFTGVSNKVILENLKRLSSSNTNIIVRIPVVPGVNDNIENINKTAEFVSSLDLKEVHLLPFHKGGVEKYRRLRRNYRFMAHVSEGKDGINLFSKILEEKKITVKIGG